MEFPHVTGVEHRTTIPSRVMLVENARILNGHVIPAERRHAGIE
jgi:hypothetical protein